MKSHQRVVFAQAFVAFIQRMNRSEPHASGVWRVFLFIQSQQICVGITNLKGNKSTFNGTKNNRQVRCEADGAKFNNGTFFFFMC